MRVFIGQQLMGLVLGFLLGAVTLQIWYHLQLSEEELRVAVPNPAVLRARGSVEESDCVCGREAEELRRLSRINSYLSKLSIPSSNTSRPRLSSQDQEDDAQLREFLYPRTISNNRTPPRGRGVAGWAESQRQPELLQDEYLFKKTVYVGVLTQQAYLATRARYLYETWGREVDGLHFFVGEDCEVPASLSHLPIVKLEGVKDNVYPPLKKTFAVLKYMYTNHIHRYNWFVRADDDLYVRVGRLKELLVGMHPHQMVYLGRSGTGRKQDVDRLHLLSHEHYCMGGPGIILSTGTLSSVGPHLTDCLNAGE